MLLKSGKTISTDFIPNPYFSVVSSSCDQFMFVKVNGLSLMDKPLLVKNVALRLPLPDNNLAILLKAETYPGAGRIDGKCADFILAYGKCLDFVELFFK